MKYLVLVLALTGSIAMANEKPPVEYVEESYEYCVDYFAGEDVTDADILDCVNEELDAQQYAQFPSLKALKAYINKK